MPASAQSRLMSWRALTSNSQLWLGLTGSVAQNYWAFDPSQPLASLMHWIAVAQPVQRKTCLNLYINLLAIYGVHAILSITNRIMHFFRQTLSTTDINHTSRWPRTRKNMSRASHANSIYLHIVWVRSKRALSFKSFSKQLWALIKQGIQNNEVSIYNSMVN